MPGKERGSGLSGGESLGEHAALLEDYRRHLSFERSLSPNTCASYSGDVAGFLAHCAKTGLSPDKAQPQDLDSYLWGIKRTTKLGPASLFRKMESLRSLYKFLAAEGRLKEDPTRFFKAPHMPHRIPEFLTGAEMQKLLSFPPQNFAELRTSAAIELFYATGIRISELINLRLESVNFDSGWILVYGKGGKERAVPMHEAAVKKLKIYLSLREKNFSGKETAAELFVNRSGGKISRMQLWKDIQKLGLAAGISRPLHPHLFRHTFASHLLQGGADLRSLQEMLGHASVNTTQIYTHVEKSGLKQAHTKAHPRA
ncbi:MAG TPA: tyrosine recombinase [Elusimicrobiales bacterium]|nr:tyrosine recombinase [Elusimicrobiales bacterium]